MSLHDILLLVPSMRPNPLQSIPSARGDEIIVVFDLSRPKGSTGIRFRIFLWLFTEEAHDGCMATRGDAAAASTYVGQLVRLGVCGEDGLNGGS